MDSPGLLIGVAGRASAILRLLDSLPAKPRVAVLALPCDDPAPLLARPSSSTRLTRPAEPGARLLPDVVTIVKPGAHLMVDGGRLVAPAPDQDGAAVGAVDLALRSLARDAGPRGIGVLLDHDSGDGAAGLREIRARGGLAFASSSASGATRDGHPIEGGHELAPARPSDANGTIRAVVAALERWPARRARDEAREPAGEAEPGPIDDATLERLAAILDAGVHVDLASYKPATVRRRVVRRMGLLGQDRPETYLEFLDASAEEQQALARDLLIGVTDFFRDPAAYDELRSLVVEPLVREARPGDVLRAWVPGCATGEEAYSLAILLLEAVQPRGGQVSVQIFGTDADEDALALARAGVYPASIAGRVSEERLRCFFTPLESGSFRVKSQLRDALSFAVHDLCRDPPFSRMHLVSCRNVLIYLRPRMQEQVLRSLHFALVPGGTLFLGTSESVGAAERPYFAVLSKKWRLFRKIGASRPVRVGRAAPRTRTEAEVLHDPPSRHPARREPTIAELARRAVLAARVPPTVVVSSANEIVFTHGDTSPYLRFPQGEPRVDLAAVIHPDLAARVRAALYKCRRENASVTASCTPDDGPCVRVTITPAPGVVEGGVIVSFETLPRSEGDAGATQAERGAAEDALLEQLERELSATREDLRNTVEELESANEELRASNEESTSMNEELQSANEELEATTEELRSLNEELASVNAQLRDKIDELEHAHDDLSNFFASTKLATLFLDHELRIKKVTPAAAELLRLARSDEGRHVGDIARDLLQNGLVAEARAVLSDLSARSGELRDGTGRWFVRRVLPYRTESRRIEGVVVTLLDVTDLRLATERLSARERQQAVVARLGISALEEGDVQRFLDRAVREVQQTLGTDLCKILELWPGEQQLFLRAGVGWRDGLVGQAVISTGLDSQAGYTLRNNEPVIVANLAQDRRFSGPTLLHEHGATSGISCLIPGGAGPFGVLSAHTVQPRLFNAEDADFLQSVALVVSGAVARHGTAQQRAVENLVAKALPDAEDLEDAVRRMQEGFVRELYTGIGELWWPSARGGTLECRLVTGEGAPAAPAERRRASLGRVHLGQGFIGRVWERGAADTVSRTYDEAELSRVGDGAPELASGFAFPIRYGDAVLGVVAAFTPRRLLADAAFLRALEGAGRALGEFLRRTTAEAAIRESEARKTAILDASLDAIITMDAEGRILECNAAAERIFGCTLEIARGRGFAELMLAEARRLAFDELMAGFHERCGPHLVVGPTEFQAVRQDGKEFPAEIVLTCIEERGRPIFIAFVRDVSDAKAAREALEQSEERLRHIFANAGVSLWEQDFRDVKALLDDLRTREVEDVRSYCDANPDFVARALQLVRLVDVNEESVRLFRAGSKQQLLRSLHLIFTPEFHGAFVDELVALAEGATLHTAQTRLQTLDGRPLDVAFTVRFPEDPAQLSGVIVSLMDVTALKRAREAEEESRLWRARLLAATPDLVLLHDLDQDRTIYANDQVATLLGRSIDQLGDGPWLTHDLVHPDDREAVRRFFDGFAADGAAPGARESLHRMRHADDSWHWLQLRAVPFVTGDADALGPGGVGAAAERPRQVLVVARDVSQLKNAEASLQEASRQKDEFLAMLGHELRNPLAAVRNAAELLRVARVSDAEMERVQTILARQTAHMAKLLDGLLDVSRIVSGKIVLDLEVLDLVGMLRDVLEDHADRIAKKGVQLSVLLQHDPLWIEADRVRVAQVFDNLLTNALKFTPPGGNIQVSARRKGEVAIVAVTDDGDGIDPDFLPHVFETFRQARQPIDRAAGGLGLGLALVRGLVRLHRGRVVARSEGRGKGAHFEVYLPVTSKAPDARAEPPKRDGGRARILIVEDNQDAAELLRHLLNAAGHETAHASDGPAALALARELQPDVVLCDVGLPGGLSGYDVARCLRADALLQNVYLVAVTGYGRPEDRQRATEAGFDAHLTKPIDLHSLEAVLENRTRR